MLKSRAAASQLTRGTDAAAAQRAQCGLVKRFSYLFPLLSATSISCNAISIGPHQHPLLGSFKHSLADLCSATVQVYVYTAGLVSQYYGVGTNGSSRCIAYTSYHSRLRPVMSLAWCQFLHQRSLVILSYCVSAAVERSYPPVGSGQPPCFFC